MKPDDLQKWRDYALKYLVMNADQRMKTFHFFIIIFTVLAGSVVAAWAQGKADTHRRALSVPCIAVTMISGLFYVIDLRSQQLIKYGRDGLLKLDELEKDAPEELKFFYLDNQRTKLDLNEHGPRISYSVAIQSMFAVSAVGGISGAVFFWVS